jgi:hypothetical protein
MANGLGDKGKQKEHMHQYYELNKTVLNKKRQVEITCESGKTFAKDHKWRHQKSTQHIKYENSKDNINNN